MNQSRGISDDVNRPSIGGIPMEPTWTLYARRRADRSLIDRWRSIVGKRRRRVVTPPAARVAGNSGGDQSERLVVTSVVRPSSPDCNAMNGAAPNEAPPTRIRREASVNKRIYSGGRRSNEPNSHQRTVTKEQSTQRDTTTVAITTTL